MTDENDYGIVPNPHYGLARVEPVTDPQREAIRRAIADVAAQNPQQPVTVYLTTPEPRRASSDIDWTRIFTAIVVTMGFLVLFSILMVSCHSQPVIVTPAPNCHFLC